MSLAQRASLGTAPLLMAAKRQTLTFDETEERSPIAAVFDPLSDARMAQSKWLERIRRQSDFIIWGAG